MIRIYTFTVAPPEGNAAELAEKIDQFLTRVSDTSKELLEAQVEVVGERFVIVMTYQGRDQWYILKKIKFPLVAALRKVGLKMENVKSTQVSAPISGRDRPTPRIPPPD